MIPLRENHIRPRPYTRPHTPTLPRQPGARARAGRRGLPCLRALALAALTLTPAPFSGALGLVAGATLFGPGTAAAEVLVATRTLRAHTPIGPGDVAVVASAPAPGSATSPEQAIGMEARVTLYAGRPIPLGSLAPAAMVERNQIVELVFTQGGLAIRAEGRALGRAGEGDLVRVMNLASRSTISGRVTAPGVVEVSP